MKRIILTTVFPLMFSFLVYSQNDSIPHFISDSLDTYIQQAMQDWNVPAIAVGIVKNGQVVYEKGFGKKKLGTSGMVNQNTLFMIGSNTKAFTATLLAILAEEGKCSLQDKVVDWVPNFTLKNPCDTKEANLVDIMSHRLGFETFQGDLLSFDSDLSTDEYLKKIGKITPMYDFRTKWGYSNAGFMVAGQCIAAISGMPWDAYLQKRILDPLEMTNTVLWTKDIRNADNVTYGHSIVNDHLQKIDYGGLDLVGPAASMSSSIHDMNIWTMALLDSGKHEGRNVIPFAAIKRTRKPESIEGYGRHAYNKTNFLLYGLGWELMDYESYELVMHTGGVHGYLSSVTLVPEENLGVVVLTNTDQNWLFLALKWEIIDAFLLLPYRNYSGNWVKIFNRNYTRDSLHLAKLIDSTQMNLEPDIRLKDLAGTYKNEVYGRAFVADKSQYLELTLEHHPQISGKLEYIGNQRFLCTYSDQTFGTQVFPFTYNKKNAPSFVLSVNSSLEFTTYTFVKEK